MSYPAQDLVDASLNNNNEVDFSWAKKDAWITWVNEALLKMTEFVDIIQDDTTITLVEDQSDYDLPSDTVRVMRVEDDEEDKVFSVDETRIDWHGEPSNFVYDIVQGDDGEKDIRILPDPESSDAGDVLSIEYSRNHTEINELSDSVNLPRITKPYLTTYLDFKFNVMDREDGRAQFNLQRWRSDIQKMMTRLRNDNESGARLLDGLHKARTNYRDGY